MFLWKQDLDMIEESLLLNISKEMLCIIKKCIIEGILLDDVLLVAIVFLIVSHVVCSHSST